MKIANCTIEDFEEIVKLYKQARAYQTHLKMVVWPIFPEEMILQEIACFNVSICKEILLFSPQKKASVLPLVYLTAFISFSL